jgi:hypothetical protein
MTLAKVVMLGVGNTALALASLYKGGISLYGTTRSAAKAGALPDLGIQPLLDAGESSSSEDSEAFLAKLSEVAAGALVLVSYPPDGLGGAAAGGGDTVGFSDRRYSPALKAANKIVYISSTGVYGKASGIIDEKTICVGDAHSVPRLAAEIFWRGQGACVLRAPGLYGPQTGLHQRLLAGTYRLPGDGSNYVSRIHLDDLAQVIDAAFRLAAPGSLYVVGDLKPCSHIEAVTWLCNLLNLPLPPSVPLEVVAPSLRGNRQIDSSCMRSQLQVALRYPTYIEGFSQCLGRKPQKAPG